MRTCQIFKQVWAECGHSNMTPHQCAPSEVARFAAAHSKASSYRSGIPVQTAEVPGLCPACENPLTWPVVPKLRRRPALTVDTQRRETRVATDVRQGPVAARFREKRVTFAPAARGEGRAPAAPSGIAVPLAPARVQQRGGEGGGGG